MVGVRCEQAGESIILVLKQRAARYNRVRYGRPSIPDVDESGNRDAEYRQSIKEGWKEE